MVSLPWWRRLRRRLYWLLTLFLLHMANVLPLAWGRGLCSGLARLAFSLRGRERQCAAANLALALPGISTADREIILRRSALYLGRNLFHTLAVKRLLDGPESIVEEDPIGDDDQCIAAWLSELAAEGRGVFILTGHIGCWELAGAWLARHGVPAERRPLGVITGTIHNPAVDRLVQRQRHSVGVRVFPRDKGAGALVRFLKDGGVVAVLLDQRTGVRNVDVPFFGQPAPTAVGMAVLALKYGIPVLPVVGVWDEAKGVQVMRHLPPIRPEEFEAGDHLGFLSRCNGALEEFIRRNPEQWVWFHQRWNPRP